MGYKHGLQAWVTSLVAILLVTACNTSEPSSVAPTPTEEVLYSASDQGVLYELNKTGDQISVQATDQQALIDKLSKSAIVIHKFSNGKTITFENKYGYAVREGDILQMPSTENAAMILKYEDYLKQQVSTSGLVRTWQCGFWGIWCWDAWNAYWPNKVVPFVLGADLTFTERTAILNSVSNWNASTKGINVKWIQNSTVADRVVFGSYYAADNSCGVADFVGKKRGVQVIVINRNASNGTCLTNATLHHEMGHVVGLEHEQNRCDRDNYISVNTYYVIQGKIGSFDKYCDSQRIDKGPYDFDSLMHYPKYAYAITDAYGRPAGATMTPRIPPLNNNVTGNIFTFGEVTKLSPGDIAAINFLY